MELASHGARVTDVCYGPGSGLLQGMGGWCLQMVSQLRFLVGIR